MAQTKVSICNLALSHIGIAKEIQDFDADKSQEAAACRRFYDICLEETLRDLYWPFATKFAALAVVEEDPTSEWAFSYRYPSDCLYIRRFLSGSRNDSRQTRVPYKLGQDDEGTLIYTDVEDAEIEYVKNETDTSKYPIDFAMALSYKLAGLIAPRITAGDPFKLKDMATKMYIFHIQKAAANAMNEEQAEEDVEAEHIRARD